MMKADSFLDQQFYQNPYPVYAALRGVRAPVYLEEVGFWFIGDYHTIAALITQQSPGIVRVSPYQIEQYAQEILNALSNQFDLVKDFALPLAIKTQVEPEVTANLISGGMLALMTHPKQYALLKAKPERIPIAVEEMLRYDSPLQIDFHTLKSRMGHLSAGTHVGLGIAAANRDPAVFHNADVFDITRKRNHHLTVGVGAERITMQVVLKLLLRQNIGLNIDIDYLRYAPTLHYRHLISLPVRLF